jgi:hypothetical protein
LKSGHFGPVHETAHSDSGIVDDSVQYPLGWSTRCCRCRRWWRFFLQPRRDLGHGILDLIVLGHVHWQGKNGALGQYRGVTLIPTNCRIDASGKDYVAPIGRSQRQFSTNARIAAGNHHGQEWWYGGRGRGGGRGTGRVGIVVGNGATGRTALERLWIVQGGRFGPEQCHEDATNGASPQDGKDHWKRHYPNECPIPTVDQSRQWFRVQPGIEPLHPAWRRHDNDI